LLAGDLHFFDNRASFFEKPRPGSGQFHITVTSFKKRHRQPLFQLTHGVADRRRNAMQLLGCGAKTTITRYRINNFQRIF
jgi:hypothetical protein